ncbi:MAG: glycogen/starch synthase [Candidatus Marinimicrobia bacterium]|nr:glycogen/starch synthase [Candidatus Neomarinimicrobiota bacterium]
MNLKIYNISKRVSPFTPPSTEGDFICNTSKVYNENKIDVRIFLPRYGYISERKYILREVIRLKEISVKMDNEELISSVKSAFIPDSRVQVYFNIFPDHYREITKQVTSNYIKPKNMNVYNAFLMYTFSALNTLERLYWKPDIILCYNWHSAIVPILLKTVLKDHDWFKNIKVVTVLSADEPFFAFPEKALKRVHVNGNMNQLTDPAGLLQTALDMSDAVIQLKSKKENKLAPLLKKKKINAILSAKKEHYKIFNINTPNNNIEFWGPIAKELYEFLDNL